MAMAVRCLVSLTLIRRVGLGEFAKGFVTLLLHPAAKAAPDSQIHRFTDSQIRSPNTGGGKAKYLSKVG